MVNIDDDDGEEDEEEEDDEQTRMQKRTKVSIQHINCQSIKNKIAKLELEAEEHSTAVRNLATQRNKK